MRYQKFKPNMARVQIINMLLKMVVGVESMTTITIFGDPDLKDSLFRNITAR
ncbi:hypothetical protein D3C73_725240 [compost metagenome]